MTISRIATQMALIVTGWMLIAGPLKADDEQADAATEPQAEVAIEETTTVDEKDGQAESDPKDSPSTEKNEAPAEAESSDDSPEKSPDAKDEAEKKEADKEEAAEDGIDEEAFLADPFSYLQSDMQSAVVDLKDGQTTPPATVTQPRILKHMGMLIEQLEKQGQGAGQAGQRVNRPAQQSSLMRGPGGENEMRAPRDDGRDWANLTPQERQKILQSKTDGFPAGYDDILADYFRRVARAETPASSPPSDAAAETESPSDGPAN